MWGISTRKTHPDEIANLNNLSNKEAAAALLDCCGSGEWVRRMLARRPFGSAQEIYNAAAQIWNELAPNDWLEAFRHHPRIGEKKAARRQSARQKHGRPTNSPAIEAASDIAKAALIEANRAYEEKFGYIFIICASGKTADEILMLHEATLDNDRDTE